MVNFLILQWASYYNNDIDGTAAYTSTDGDVYIRRWDFPIQFTITSVYTDAITNGLVSKDNIPALSCGHDKSYCNFYAGKWYPGIRMFAIGF